MPNISQIENWELSRIQPYDNNAKLHPQEHIDQIANSIGEFDFLDPVAVDENGILLEGHGRLLAAKVRGMASVPVIQVSGLTDAQKVAYRLVHNKLTLNTDFDPEMLKLDFGVLGDLDFDLSLTGFSAEELDLSQVDNDRPISVGEGSEEWDKPIARCQRNQVWKLGRHKLLCGDSTDKENIERLLQGQCPDLIWSDPPYGIKCQKADGTIGGGDDRVSTKKYPRIAGDDSTEVAIASFNLYQDLFPKSVQVWWGANHYAEGLPNSSCWIVWDKLNGDSDFADCELAWTNQKSAVRKFSFMWNGLMKQGEATSKKRIHPNQKPVEMVSWFWDKYCEDKLLCFDPFLGSGASIIAAEKDGDRIVYGCELMPEYADLVLQRWEQESGGTAELIEPESTESILGF